MPIEDSIMLWVNNESSFYDDVRRMYDKWVEEGDLWSDLPARAEASNLIHHIAEAIEAMDFNQGEHYTAAQKKEAVDEVMDDFDDYRDEAIESAIKEVQRKPKPEDLNMDAGEIEYAKKMEEMLKRMGPRYDIEMLRGYMPVSQQRIRQALERGDKHLNSISLRKWDDQAKMLGRPWVGFSLADGVGILKHVAKWHYA